MAINLQIISKIDFYDQIRQTEISAPCYWLMEKSAQAHLPSGAKRVQYFSPLSQACFVASPFHPRQLQRVSAHIQSSLFGGLTHVGSVRAHLIGLFGHLSHHIHITRHLTLDYPLLARHQNHRHVAPTRLRFIIYSG